MTQSSALNILKTGVNVFLTGEPGSGKTHTINQYVAYLRSHGLEPAITASTGIAATHIGGMTIHSWSGLGIKDELSRRDLAEIADEKLKGDVGARETHVAGSLADLVSRFEDTAKREIWQYLLMACLLLAVCEPLIANWMRPDRQRDTAHRVEGARKAA